MTADATWHFRRMHPGEMNIDPIEAEFFSTEALDSLADALVREAVQNSLDARRPGLSARVRFAFPRASTLLRDEQRYLRGLDAHLRATRSGLASAPAADEPMSWLVIEELTWERAQGVARTPRRVIVASISAPLASSYSANSSTPSRIR